MGQLVLPLHFLLQSNREVDELVIVTRQHDKAVGDALDLADITPLTGPADVFAGNYEDAHDADVVVITLVYRESLAKVV